MGKGYFIKKLAAAAAGVIMAVSCISSSVSAVEYGIDVSRYQGNINWSALGSSGLKFVILRAGTTKYGIDSRFEEYYAGTRQAGIKTGAYLYVSALTLEEFREAAEVFLQYLEGKNWELPVYIDLEDNAQTALGKQTLTTYAIAALNIISDAGYRTGVYANKNWFTNFIDREMILRAGYEVWWAQYPAQLVNPLDYDKSDVCGIWQYSSHGKVQGIPDAWVDLDIAYRIYNETRNISNKPAEIWVSTISTALRCMPGNEYGELVPVPPETFLSVKDKRTVNGKEWAKVNYLGYSGWCLLDGAKCIFKDNEEENTQKFDVNHDGKINVKDDIELKKFILSSGKSGIRTDINGDGRINILDSQRLKAYILSKIIIPM